MPLAIPKPADANRWQGFVEPEPGLALPCTRLWGRAPGPKLVITAGVHGAEYSSIEAARRLTALAPEEFSGQITLLPILNIEAFWKHLAFQNPRDGKNINRTFPGDPKGGPSERLAAWLIGEIVTGADAYIDLHCGDMTEALTPFSVYPSSDERSAELAVASGLPYAVHSDSKGLSYSGAVGVGVPGLILESGGNGLWTEETVALLIHGVRRIMAHLGMLRDAGVPAVAKPKRCRMVVTAAPEAGFWYPAVALGSMVEAGGTLGIMRDLIGRWERPIASAQAGPVIYHSTSLAASQGEALVGIAVA